MITAADRLVWFGSNFSAVRSFPACRGRYHITPHNTPWAVNHTLKYWLLINSAQRNGLQYAVCPKINWSCNVICFIIFSRLHFFSEIETSDMLTLNPLPLCCRHTVYGLAPRWDIMSVVVLGRLCQCFFFFHLLTLAYWDFPCGCAWLKVG